MTDKSETEQLGAIVAEQAAEESEQEAREQRQYQNAYAETIYNGTCIRWRYWVEQMPKLSAAEAARLMHALDPDLFQNLDHRPNKNDPSKRCANAAATERLAERQGMEVATPTEWLEWATQQRLAVHDGFRLAVESAPATDTATPAPVVTASVTPALPKSKRPDLLTPLIEAAQRGETDPFNAAVIWPKLCSMAERKTRPLIGVSADGIKWTDSNDTVQFLTKSALSDRLRRAKTAR